MRLPDHSAARDSLMIGKLFRLLGIVVASLSIGTVLAQALALGYCWSQGWLEPSRLERGWQCRKARPASCC